METSKRMSLIRPNKTKPEVVIRKILIEMGHRYRKNLSCIPGRPDIVFTKKRKIIFINGCFWHRHPNCKKATFPKSNVMYWEKKFQRTLERDKLNLEKLLKMDWSVLVIWECELRNMNSVRNKIKDFLEG